LIFQPLESSKVNKIQVKNQINIKSFYSSFDRFPSVVVKNVPIHTV